MSSLPKIKSILITLALFIVLLTVLILSPFFILRGYILKKFDRDLDNVFYLEVDKALESTKMSNLARLYLSKTQSFYSNVLHEEFLAEFPNTENIYKSFDYTVHPAVFIIRNYNSSNNEVTMEFEIPTDFAEFTAVSKLNCDQQTTNAGIYSQSHEAEKWAIINDLLKGTLNNTERETLTAKLAQTLSYEEIVDVHSNVGVTVEELLKRPEIVQDKRLLKIVTTCREDECNNTSEQCVLFIP